MVRESYQEQLRRLRDDVMAMGEKTVDRLKLGLAALKDPDPDVVARLEEGDEEIDDLYLAIDRQCTDLLALQQPVAVDLRLITASSKIIIDLERIADLALNLGQYALKYSAQYEIVPLADLLAVGDITIAMIDEVIAAYSDSDVARAEAAIKLDDEVDDRFWKLSSRLLQNLITSGTSKHRLDEAAQIAENTMIYMLSLRDLERAADHAVTIGGWVVYIVTARKDLL